ncbi:MAG: hypothetical protein ACI4DR_00040 [Roseburia sp.]
MQEFMDGIEDYSYTKDGKEIKSLQYKVKLASIVTVICVMYAGRDVDNRLNHYTAM